jgi:CDP-diacylglycerol pyrophosphatase
MRKAFILPVAVVAIALVSGGFQTWQNSRRALWHIVNERCVPEAAAGKLASCVQVTTDPAEAVLKDRRGVLQYLLIPTRRLTGIEDPRLMGNDVPSYFSDAWEARSWLERKNGAPIPRDDLAITMNSAWGRSQDQFHLHISCVRADLKARLAALDKSIGSDWVELKDGWQGHRYLVRWLDGVGMNGFNPVREIVAKVPDAATSLGQHSLAVVGGWRAGSPGFWILDSRNRVTEGWLGGIEGDVQDHGCGVLAAR